MFVNSYYIVPTAQLQRGSFNEYLSFQLSALRSDKAGFVNNMYVRWCSFGYYFDYFNNVFNGPNT